MRYPYAVQLILDRYPCLKPEDVAERLRYSSFVSVSKRYLYFQVPKAACTKMKELLRALENAPPIKLLADNAALETRRDMFIHARENVPLPSLVDLDDRTQREVLESPVFLRMTFVRNPYTRLVSAWKNKVMLCEPGYEYLYVQIKGHLPEFHAKSLITFEEFVEYIATQCDLRTCNPHWRRQTDQIFSSALPFSFIGKIERMAEGLRRFEQHLGLSQHIVDDARNASGARDAGIYDGNLADKVYSLYEADFEALGYDRSAWPGNEPGSSERPQQGIVREETFNDEVIERNIIISLLYEERNRLRAQLHRASRLHLLAAADAVFSLRNIGFKFPSSMKAWFQRVLCRLFISTGGRGKPLKIQR